MMDIVNVKGNNEIIWSLEDIYYLIEKYMGYDMRKVTEETFTDFLEIEEIRTRNEKEEKENYEASLESNSYAFRDIKDEIEVLSKMERFSRKAVLETINNVSSIVDSQI